MTEWAPRLKRSLVCGVVASVGFGLLSLFMPNYYVSNARLLPVEARGGMGGLGSLASAAAAFGLNVPGGEGSDANFQDILESRSIGEQLLTKTYSYRQRSWYFGSGKTKTTTLQAYFRSKNLDKGMEDLGRHLSVNRDVKSKVITVSMETKSPELSQEVVREAVRLLGAFVQRAGQTRGSAKALFAQARLAEARADMARSQENLRRFLDVNRNYLASADPAIHLQGSTLEAEFKLRQQLVATLALSLEQALMDEKNDVPMVNVLDPGNLPIEKSRPARTVIAFLIFILGSLGTWAWSSRDWLVSTLVEIGGGKGDPSAAGKEQA